MNPTLEGILHPPIQYYFNQYINRIYDISQTTSRKLVVLFYFNNISISSLLSPLWIIVSRKHHHGGNVLKSWSRKMLNNLKCPMNKQFKSLLQSPK